MLCRRLHGVDGGQRSLLPAPRPAGALSRGLKQGWVSVVQFLVALASLAHGLADHLARKADGAFHKIVLDDAVDQAERQSFLCGDGLPEGAHLDGLGHAHQARQPLGAPRAWDQPDFHLRLSHPRRRSADTVVRAHRQLETTAEGRPVNRRHDGFRRVLDLQQKTQRQQGRPRPLARDDLLNLPQVRAAAEGLTGARDDYGADMGIGAGFAERRLYAQVHFLGECVHGRVGELDDSYFHHFCFRISSASAGTTSNRSPTIP